MLTPNIILIAAGVLVVFLIVMIIWLTKDLARSRKAKKAAKAEPVQAAQAAPPPVKAWLLATERMVKGSTIVFRCNYVVTQGSTTRDICPFEVVYAIKADAADVDIVVPEAMLEHMGKHAKGE